MFECCRDQWRYTTSRPVVVDRGVTFYSICTAMEAENRPRNVFQFHMGRPHRLILFLGRGELCTMV